MKKVEVSIPIAVLPEKVIDAFTEFDLLKGWWGVERCLVEKRPSGNYALTWGITENGFQYVSSGVVKDHQPGQLLVVDHMCYFNPERPILGGMSLTVKVTPKEDGCLLNVCQDGYQTGADWDWYYEAVRTAWPQALQHLKTFLEKK